MKRLLLILFVTTTLLACKKDKKEQNKFEGRWDLTKWYNYTTVNGTKQGENTETYTVGQEYITFTGNSCILYQDGKQVEKGTFTSDETSLTITSGNGEKHTSKIRWNNDNEFVVLDVYDATNGTFYYDEETYKRN